MGDWAGRVESARVPAGYTCDIDGSTAAGRADSRADSASYMLSTVFGWTTSQVTDSISPGVYGTPHSFSLQADAAAGTVFATGPAELSGEVTYYSALRVTAGEVAGVTGSKALYSHSGGVAGAGVWMAPHGTGTVVYMGWNWRTYAWSAPKDGSHWTAVLRLALSTTPSAAAVLPPPPPPPPPPSPTRTYTLDGCPFMAVRTTSNPLVQNHYNMSWLIVVLHQQG
jgi:hypothetical protein